MQDQSWTGSMVNNGGAITDDVGHYSYQERKENQVCTYPGCSNEPADDSLECPAHRDSSRARKRKSKRSTSRKLKALRKAWAHKNRCLRCGGVRVRGGKHCAKCVVYAGEARAALVDKQVDNKRRRIESNTTVDAGGRTRYRGQGKRGRQSVAAIDEKDLQYALDALQRMKDGLAFATSLATAQLPRFQRQDAINAALSLGDVGIRFVEEVLDRHGHFGPVDPASSKIGR